MSEQSDVNFAIFVSGFGNGAIEIIKNKKNNLVNPHVGLLLSSNPGSASLKVAEEHGISRAVVERSNYRDKQSFEWGVLEELFRHDIDYIFLAGYRLLIDEVLLDEYENRIINIHPSLLPVFKGMDAIGQALKAGVKITGITTHIVTSELDSGKILGQRSTRIGKNDTFETLNDKIFKLGAILTIETINNYFTDKRTTQDKSEQT